VPEAELDSSATKALGDAITYYVYANSHILVYPIPGPDGETSVGERLINFVWYRNYLAGDDLESVLTDRDGVRREVSVPPGAMAPVHVGEARAVATARLPPLLAHVVHATTRLQVIMDLVVPRMAFNRICLVGDAAFVARPHAAAGTAKAAADGWALADALVAEGDVPAALRAWEPDQLALGRRLVDRTQRVGRRSQVDGTWESGDPELIFGLWEPGR
jgi:2,6-dihydroxypyridine 3-monooxygenase